MNTKRLQQAVDILKKRYKHEIQNDSDWFYYLTNYTVNIHDNEGEDVFTVVVYPLDKATGQTDFNNWIYLEPFDKNFELTYEPNLLFHLLRNYNHKSKIREYS